MEGGLAPALPTPWRHDGAALQFGDSGGAVVACELVLD
jgi:hypothetical protein